MDWRRRRGRVVKGNGGDMANFRGEEGGTASCPCETSFIVEIRVSLGGSSSGKVRDAKVADFDRLAIFSP